MTAGNDDSSLTLASERDIVTARREIRRLAQEIGLSLIDQTKIVTAASELARNAVVYGGGGKLQWQVASEDGKLGLRVTVSDRGPGIEDLNLAMKDGWTTGLGLGLGLPGTKRLVNEFNIDSRPGFGTTVVVVKWKTQRG